LNALVGELVDAQVEYLVDALVGWAGRRRGRTVWSVPTGGADQRQQGGFQTGAALALVGVRGRVEALRR
jgi:hypothetical protein